MDKYDYVVIGAGPAGYVSAVEAAKKGLKTAVIDKDENHVGGVCLNQGCIPAKSLFNSARGFDYLVKEAGSLGTGNLKPDMAKFIEKAKEASALLQKGIFFLFKKHGIDFFSGEAGFRTKNIIKITGSGGNNKEIEGEKILIATGSVPKELKQLPFDGKNVLTSADIIFSKEVPENILIIGGGAIGIEFADYLNILGAKVTILEIEDRILPSSDREVSKEIGKNLGKNGVGIITSAFFKKAEVKGDVILTEIEKNGQTETRKYAKVLVSVGRAPNLSGLGLEKTGVSVDENGFIKTKSDVRTDIRDIFTAGDVAGHMMLAHTASEEGRMAGLEALGINRQLIDYTSIPQIVYTRPEAASVGMTEEEAKLSGGEVLVAKHFFKANGKAVLSRKSDGFIKVIISRKTRKFLGVHIVGPEAGELIHEFVLAKRTGLTADDIAQTVHAHPSFSEIAGDVSKSL